LADGLDGTSEKSDPVYFLIESLQWMC